MPTGYKINGLDLAEIIETPGPDILELEENSIFKSRYLSNGEDLSFVKKLSSSYAYYENIDVGDYFKTDTPGVETVFCKRGYRPRMIPINTLEGGTSVITKYIGKQDKKIVIWNSNNINDKYSEHSFEGSPFYSAPNVILFLICGGGGGGGGSSLANSASGGSGAGVAFGYFKIPEVTSSPASQGVTIRLGNRGSRGSSGSPGKASNGGYSQITIDGSRYIICNGGQGGKTNGGSLSGGSVISSGLHNNFIQLFNSATGGSGGSGKLGSSGGNCVLSSFQYRPEDSFSNTGSGGSSPGLGGGGGGSIGPGGTGGHSDNDHKGQLGILGGGGGGSSYILWRKRKSGGHGGNSILKLYY